MATIPLQLNTAELDTTTGIVTLIFSDAPRPGDTDPASHQATGVVRVQVRPTGQPTYHKPGQPSVTTTPEEMDAATKNRGGR